MDKENTRENYTVFFSLAQFDDGNLVIYAFTQWENGGSELS